MSKRGAASELTNKNRKDEEPEEAETFRKVSAVEMTKRKILIANRHEDAAGSPIGEGTSMFKEISSFSNVYALADSSLPPSFSLSNKNSYNSASNVASSLCSGKTESEPKKSTFSLAEIKSSVLPTLSFKSNNSNGTSESTSQNNEEVTSKVNGFGINNKSKTSEKKSDSPFMTELKSLNETFLKWIKKKLDENVYVNLIPILEDYKTYFQNLTQKYAGGVNISDKMEQSNGVENKLGFTNVKSNKPIPQGDSRTIDKAVEIPKPPLPFLSKCDARKKSTGSSLNFGSSAYFSSNPLTFIFGRFAETPKPQLSFLSKCNASKNLAFNFDSNKIYDNKPPSFTNENNSRNGLKYGTGSRLNFGSSANSSSHPFNLGGFATASVPTTTTKEKIEEEETDEDKPPEIIINKVKENYDINENKCKFVHMKDKECVESELGTLFCKKTEEKTQLTSLEMPSSSTGQMPQSSELSILLSQLNTAIKTTARDVLVLLYNQRFQKYHSGKTPISVLNKIPVVRNKLRRNKKLKQAIISNDINTFGPTAIFLLLKNVCGLAKINSAAWNENKFMTLEGNIEKIIKIINLEARWTEANAKIEDVKQAWQALFTSTINILVIGKFDSVMRREVSKEFEMIKKNCKPGKAARMCKQFSVATNNRKKEQFIPLLNDLCRTSNNNLMKFKKYLPKHPTEVQKKLLKLFSKEHQQLIRQEKSKFYLKQRQ